MYIKYIIFEPDYTGADCLVLFTGATHWEMARAINRKVVSAGRVKDNEVIPGSVSLNNMFGDRTEKDTQLFRVHGILEELI